MTNLYKILPFESVGGLKFGASLSEVRDHFCCIFRTFNRGGVQPHLSDFFVEIGVFAYYDANARLEAIETASPAHAILESCDISALSIRELAEFLARRDVNLKLGIDNVISPSLGVSAWASDAKENPNAPVETVLAFAHGYYAQFPMRKKRNQ